MILLKSLPGPQGQSCGAHMIVGLQLYPADGCADVTLVSHWDLEEVQNGAPGAGGAPLVRRVDSEAFRAAMAALIAAAAAEISVEGDFAGAEAVDIPETIRAAHLRLEADLNELSRETILAGVGADHMVVLQDAESWLFAKRAVIAEPGETPEQRGERAAAATRNAERWRAQVDWMRAVQGEARSRLDRARSIRRYTELQAAEPSLLAPIDVGPLPAEGEAAADPQAMVSEGLRELMQEGESVSDARARLYPEWNELNNADLSGRISEGHTQESQDERLRLLRRLFEQRGGA